MYSRRKLVPTFCCPSLSFRRLGVCLDLGTFFSFDLVLGLVFGLSSFPWPGFGSGPDPCLCVCLRLPGAPGFPCEEHGTILLAVKQYSLPSSFKCILKHYRMLQLTLLIRSSKMSYWMSMLALHSLWSSPALDTFHSLYRPKHSQALSLCN